MAITDDLLDELASALGPAIKPSLTSSSAASDLFEAYTFSLVLQAARTEGAKVSYRDPHDKTATKFIFRTSPGYLWSTTQDYTFAVLDFPNVPPLEAHLGVRVSGKSGVLHEFDVCVLHRSEGITSRRWEVHPRYAKVLIGIECKFYAASLELGLARAFIGLGTDVTAKNTFFVTNTTSASVEKLLSARDRSWGSKVAPGSTVDVERMRNEFQTVFKYYKAR